MSGVYPIWQAIIAAGEFIETAPIPVCDFARKWARCRGRDRTKAGLTGANLGIIAQRMSLPSSAGKRGGPNSTFWVRR